MTHLCGAFMNGFISACGGFTTDGHFFKALIKQCFVNTCVFYFLYPTFEKAAALSGRRMSDEKLSFPKIPLF